MFSVEIKIYFLLLVPYDWFGRYTYSQEYFKIVLQWINKIVPFYTSAAYNGVINNTKIF